MRWVFYGLLLINLGYFLFQTLLPTEKDARPVALKGDQDSNADTILLLREAEEVVERRASNILDELAAQQLSVESEEEKQQQTEAVETLCIAYGAFVDRQQSEFFRTNLASAGLDASLYEEALSSNKQFWAYIPSFGEFEKALLAINQLAQNNISAYLISEGDHINGLSLGVYEQEADVESIEQTLSALGYELVLEEKTSTYSGFWVEMTPDQDRESAQYYFTQLQADFPSIKQQEKVCKAVASQG